MSKEQRTKPEIGDVKEVKAYLVRKNMSASSLAKKADVNKESLNRWLSGSQKTIFHHVWCKLKTYMTENA